MPHSIRVRFSRGPWAEGETERWMAYLRPAGNGVLLLRVGRFTRTSNQPVEELGAPAREGGPPAQRRHSGVPRGTATGRGGRESRGSLGHG